MRGGNGLSHLGNVIYWIAAAVFAMIAGRPDTIMLAVVAVLALPVWLGGFAVRYIVSG